MEALFADGDAETRHRRYADEMARLYQRLPDDADVASFYALALLGTMSRGLIGHRDAHEGHSQTLAGSETQSRVSEILGRVLRAHPEHLGALHYLLHNDDDPEHAHLALAAARTLATLAPDSSHARHMPSHIFLQLGLWHDAADSDRAAFAASEAWVQRKQLNPALRSYHALAWLQYELLQLGRRHEAWATLDQIAPIVEASQSLTLLSDLSTMRARYVVESADWPRLANESTFGNVNELCAIGMSAARMGNVELAERARQGLAQRAQDPREGDLRPAAVIMEREVAALLALGAGRGADAVAHSAGGRAERGAAAGSPGPARADQAGAGTARRSADRAGTRRGSGRAVRAGAAPQPQSLALGARARSRIGSGAEARGRSSALRRVARQHGSRGRRSPGARRGTIGAGRPRAPPDSSPLLSPRALIVTSVAVARRAGTGLAGKKKGPGCPGPSKNDRETKTLA